MQLTTATCTLLVGAALVMVELRKRQLVYVLSATVALLAATSLVANLFGFESIFLDNFVLEPFEEDSVYPSGRMSTASAISFLALSMACVVLVMRSSLLQRSITSLLAAVAMGYAVFSLTGYAGNYLVGFGWGILTGMSMVTSLCVVGLSAVASLYAWRGYLDRSSDSMSGNAFAISIALSLLVILLAMGMELRETLIIHDRAELETEQLAREAESEFGQTVQAMARMAQRIEHDRAAATNLWQVDARSYAEDIPGLELVVWLSPDGTRQHVEQSGEEYSPGLIDEYSRVVTAAHERDHDLYRRTFMTGPVTLADGTTGFVIVGEVVPVAGAEPGFVFGIISPETYLSEFLHTDVWEDFDIEIHSPNGIVMDHDTGSALDRKKFVSESVLPAGDEKWRLVVAPSLDYVGKQRSRIAEAILIAGLILANLTGLSLQLARTARRKSEQLEESVEQLELREERLSNLVGALPDAVLTVSATGEIEEVNPAAKVVFKCSEKDLLGVKLSEILTEKEDDEDAAELISRLKTNRMEKLFGKAYATLARRTDHTTFPVALSVAPFKTPEGRKFVWIIRDITRQVEAEQEIRRKAEEISELAQRYSALVDCGAIGVGRADSNGVVVESNEALQEMLGYSADELGQMKFSDFTHAEDQAIGIEQYRDLVNGERDFYNARKRYVRKDGRIVWADVTATAVRDAADNLKYVIGLAQDVTERVRAREAIEASESRMQSLVESDPDATILVDRDGKVVVFNQMAEELFGWDRDEIIGKSVELLLPEKLRAAHVEQRAEYMRSPEKRAMAHGRELVALHKDGHTIPVEISLSPLDYDDGMMTVASVRDVTERRAAQEAIRESQERLKEVNKELESIVYVASHDLRSPLVNLQGFSRQMGSSAERLHELLGDGVLSNELKAEVQPLLEQKIPEALGFIESSTVKMDRLIKGLLRLSRLGRIELRPKQVDVNALMQEVINSMQFMLAQHKIEVEVSDLPPCWGDEDQLNQVFSNLVDNAIKYRSHERDSVIRISGECHDDHVEYVVEDNGVGIDPRHQQIIFEIFHRLKPRDGIGGEGLGLSVVRRILDRSNGSIRVESEEGTGSRFILCLPSVRTPAHTHNQ